MKIEINYDLMDKIKEAKTGFSLNKTVKHILPRTLAASSLYTILNLSNGNVSERFLRGVLLYLALYGTSYSITSLICLKRSKEIAIKQLRLLSRMLNNINISTSYELLLDSDNYKTEYKLNFNESKIPSLKQDKFINVPIYDDGSIKEVSLVQEHVIGSNKYSLSYGSAKKVLRPAFSSI